MVRLKSVTGQECPLLIILYKMILEILSSIMQKIEINKYKACQNERGTNLKELSQWLQLEQFDSTGL